MTEESDETEDQLKRAGLIALQEIVTDITDRIIHRIPEEDWRIRFEHLDDGQHHLLVDMRELVRFTVELTLRDFVKVMTEHDDEEQ